MEPTVVIKVKHEETLRRFNACIVKGKLDLNLESLREKIHGLFKFTPDTDLVLTYIDEDHDMVTLGDDEDLHDVVRGALNPLRITVKLSTEKSGRSSTRTSGSSTPLRSPQVQQPSENLNSGVSEFLKAVPEPVRQVITKVFTDLAPTAATSAQPLALLVRCLLEKLQHHIPIQHSLPEYFPPLFPPNLPHQIPIPCPQPLFIPPNFPPDLPHLQAGASISGQGGAPVCSSTEGSKFDGTASDVLSSGGYGNSSSLLFPMFPPDLPHLNPIPLPVLQAGANISGQGGSPVCSSTVTASQDVEEVYGTASDVLSSGRYGYSSSLLFPPLFPPDLPHLNPIPLPVLQAGANISWQGRSPVCSSTVTASQDVEGSKVDGTASDVLSSGGYRYSSSLLFPPMFPPDLPHLNPIPLPVLQAGANISGRGGSPLCFSTVTASQDVEEVYGTASDVLSSGGYGNSSSLLFPPLFPPDLPHLNPIPLPVLQAGANISWQGGSPVCSSTVTASQDVEGSKVDGTASDVLSSGGYGNSSSKSKDVFLSSESKDRKNDKENFCNLNGSVKAPTRQVPGLVEVVMEPTRQVPGLVEVVMEALDSANRKSALSKKKEVDKSGENLSSENFVNISSSTVSGDYKEASGKPNESTGKNSMNAYPFPCYPANMTWSNLHYEATHATAGAKNVFKTCSGNSSGSILVPSPIGTPLGNSPAVAQQLPSCIVQPRRNNGQNDGSGIVFHRGVQCDGCGVHPITGPRFKCKVKDDYDLCSICFDQMGNENDYIRIDHPVTYRNPYGLYALHNWVHPPVQPPVFRCGGVKHGRLKLDSRFIQDVNILDGTLLAPSTPFTKIWRMRNNGSVVWPQGTQLVWIGGDKLSDIFSVEIQIASTGLPVDQELDVAVDFVTPDRHGRYISYWRMASPSGQKFGQRVWVLIQVDASSKELPREGFRGFNLNFPPVSNGSLPEIGNSNEIAVQLVEPVVSASPQKEQELNFPINDILLVSGGAPSPVPDAPSSPVPSPLPSHVTVVPTSAEVVKENAKVEETLPKVLNEMHFEQVDLNKEISRLNEYDLEKSVDDLCDDVSDWDTILEELQVMGFHDKSTNKKLLKKNNGNMT